MIFSLGWNLDTATNRGLATARTISGEESYAIVFRSTIRASRSATVAPGPGLADRPFIPLPFAAAEDEPAGTATPFPTFDDIDMTSRARTRLATSSGALPRQTRLSGEEVDDDGAALSGVPPKKCIDPGRTVLR